MKNNQTKQTQIPTSHDEDANAVDAVESQSQKNPNTDLEKPNLGNYAEYSSKLKRIFQSAANKNQVLYNRLKTAIQAKEITVNKVYIPANSRIFSIMFYHKDLSETVIRAVIGEDIMITDPLVEHRNDILKAIESSIWVDVFLKDTTSRVYTLDMQRKYFKQRNRNRSIYYGAKELAAQEVNDCRYEKLKQVSITFIYENNTTPRVAPIAKIQPTDVDTKEVYTDLLTLYEVNLNKIFDSDEQGLPENLVILKSFLSIQKHEDLDTFVTTYDTEFSRRLIMEYMDAILDDEILLKVEGSERFMLKLSEEVLLEEREEGRLEGEAIGISKGELRTLVALIHRKKLKHKTRGQIIDELELNEAEVEILDHFNKYTYLLG